MDSRVAGSPAALVLSVLALASAGCAQQTVPEELWGRWTTADTRYEGRAFELTDSALRIFTASNESTRHDIRSVDAEITEDGQQLLTINYEDQGRNLQFSVAYDRPGSDGVPGWVHLANQPDFEWTRSGGGP